MSEPLTKEQIKQPDAFEKAAVRLLDFRSERYRTVLKLLALGLAAALATAAFMFYRQYQSEKIQNELAELNRKQEKLNYTSENDVNALLSAYRDIISRSDKGSEVSAQAIFQRSVIFKKLNNEQKLVEELKVLTDDPAQNQLYRAMAFFELAELNSKKGNYAEAVKILNSVSIAIFEDRKLFELGLAYLNDDKPAEAKKYFKQLTEQYQSSLYIGFASNMAAINMDYLDFVVEHSGKKNKHSQKLTLFERVLLGSKRARDLYDGKTLTVAGLRVHKPTSAAVYELNHNKITPVVKEQKYAEEEEDIDV
ncbi:hypothetical protein CHS0354_006950 [Potamilus streckersoni]|uniref:Tetratricopeptide repeat protein n=1 Tax=Potamilus streckersoni TaxID=2493646 RepID=A0AAE0WC89_9BIVA|nr:hypothetical protein CHS0354_006950 [Potamilus streckersoni]